MIRCRLHITAAILSVIVAGIPLHAEETTSGKWPSSATKRHAAKKKRGRKHYAMPSAARSAPSEQPKQYGHVVLEDVRINTMGVRCTIKRIRLLYKGDGIDASVVGNVLPKNENLVDESPSAAAYFIMPSKHGKAPEPEAMESASLVRLAAEDKKEVKVVLWTYMNLDPPEEFIQADRRLAVKLAEEIHRLSDENKEKVTIVKPDLVEQYKSRNPNWKSYELTKVGREFNADYVVELGIDKLSLYEPNANQQIFRGQTHILVNVVNMKNPDEMQTKEFTDCYPPEARGDMTPFDMTSSAFRDQFIDHAAKRLAFYFVKHKRPTNDD